MLYPTKASVGYNDFLERFQRSFCLCAFKLLFSSFTFLSFTLPALQRARKAMTQPARVTAFSFCSAKDASHQSVVVWGRLYGFCKALLRRICTLLHAQKSTRKAPATFEAREARTRGCSPLVTPKKKSKRKKASRFANAFFSLLRFGVAARRYFWLEEKLSSAVVGNAFMRSAGKMHLPENERNG